MTVLFNTKGENITKRQKMFFSRAKFLNLDLNKIFLFLFLLCINVKVWRMDASKVSNTYIVVAVFYLKLMEG